MDNPYIGKGRGPTRVRSVDIHAEEQLGWLVRTGKPEAHTPPETVRDILEYIGRCWYVLHLGQGPTFDLVPTKYAVPESRVVPVTFELGEAAIYSGTLYHLTRYGRICQRIGWEELDLRSDGDWCMVQ